MASFGRCSHYANPHDIIAVRAAFGTNRKLAVLISAGKLLAAEVIHHRLIPDSDRACGRGGDPSHELECHFSRGFIQRAKTFPWLVPRAAWRRFGPWFSQTRLEITRLSGANPGNMQTLMCVDTPDWQLKPRTLAATRNLLFPKLMFGELRARGAEKAAETVA